MMTDRLENPELHCRIEKLRTDLKMTQPEFAAALGMDAKKGRSTINNWESGANKIKDDDLKHIAKTFGASSDWLLGLTDVKSPSMEIRAMCDFTGLDDSAINLLHRIPLIADMLNLLFADPEALVKMCAAMNNLYDCAAALTAALENGVYDYDECRKDANTSLFDFEDSIRNNVSIYQGVRALRDQLQSPMDRALAIARGEAHNGEHTES